MTLTRIARPVAALGAGALALLATLVLTVGPAAAHVTVNPDEAEGGGYSKLTFRVPTESDTASTTRLQVYLPADSGLASVSVKPHPGWTAKVARSGDAVSAITWTPDARSDAIAPGEFDEFDVAVGPLPKSGTLVFKVLQTYSDGSVVRWIEVPKAGEAEPEHPAPVLTITPTAATTTSGTVDTADSGDGGSTGPWVVSVVALVLAAAALATTLLRPRRSSPGARRSSPGAK